MVHFTPYLTVPLALVIAGFIVWYWMRLGHADVPASRRIIRRVSMMLMLIALPMFLNALSFLSPESDRDRYIIAWTLALGTILLVIITAGVDALNSVRLLRRAHESEVQDASIELAKAIRRRRADGATAQEPDRADVVRRSPRHAESGGEDKSS
jgi:hypothetical protein